MKVSKPKNYERRVRYLLRLCVGLSILSLYIFYSYYRWFQIWVIPFSWSALTFFLAWCYNILKEKNAKRDTTRKEEFYFLTIRLLILIPMVVILFGEIPTEDIYFGYALSISCTLVLSLIFLSLDKFELEILFEHIEERSN